MSRETATRDPYLVKSVVHSSQVLAAFRSSGERWSGAANARRPRLTGESLRWSGAA